METDWCRQLAEGLIENGCQYLSIALMEGAKEVQKQVSSTATRLKFPLFTEDTISEKIGYEVALAYSYGKKRSAFLTHGFSLPVAMDPLMSSIYTGVAGGFVVIAVDTTPSPSYGNVSDPVSLSMFAKMPVLEVSHLGEMTSLLKRAYGVSERFETPVLVHLDTKVPKEASTVTGKTGKKRRTDFEKNPARWAATPRFRFLLHQKLNRRLRKITASGGKDYLVHIQGKEDRIGILCNHANLFLVKPWAKRHGISVLSVQMPFPLPVAPLSEFIRSYRKIFVIEDRFPTIQFQLPERKSVRGRLTDRTFSQVASWNEASLIPFLDRLLGKKSREKGTVTTFQNPASEPKTSIVRLLENLRKRVPAPLIIADKTPLTIQLPVDHFVSRGGAISFIAGYAHARGRRPALAISDSHAFLHYGMQAVTNAVHNAAPIKCLVIVYPEHVPVIHTFLGALTPVKVVPLDMEGSESDGQTIFEDLAESLTIYTVSMKEAA